MKYILSTEKLVIPEDGECQFTYPDFSSMNRAELGRGGDVRAWWSLDYIPSGFHEEEEMIISELGIQE